MELEISTIISMLEQLRDACHENSVAKGFWETEPWNFAEKIALIHSELSEALEAWRKHKTMSDKDISIFVGNLLSEDNPLHKRRITAIEEEFADVFIRLLDLCGKMDIDVGRIVVAKMKYNEGRPYMHGGCKI